MMFAATTRPHQTVLTTCVIHPTQQAIISNDHIRKATIVAGKVTGVETYAATCDYYKSTGKTIPKKMDPNTRYYNISYDDGTKEEYVSAHRVSILWPRVVLKERKALQKTKETGLGIIRALML